MLTLFYAPGACSMAAHIVLEESGEKYEAKRVDLAKGEQRTEAYLKIHPLGRVPALLLDDGEPLDREHGDPALSRQALRAVAEGRGWPRRARSP